MASKKSEPHPLQKNKATKESPAGAVDAGAAGGDTLRLPTPEIVDIDTLVPYATNARTHTDAQVDKIMASMERFGFTNPVLVWKDNVIIAGHGRVLAAKKKGYKKIPILRADYMSDAERKAYVLADNRLATEAGWDHELLRVEMAGLQELGIDLSATGFDPDEINDLLAQAQEGLTDDDKVPDLQQPVSRPGDVWLLGRHRVMCGDSLNETDLQKLLGGSKPELLFTDPPYDFDTDGGGILGQRQHPKDIKKRKLDEFDPSVLILHCETNIFFHNKPLIKKYIELGEVNKKTWDLHFYKKENPVPNHGGHVMTDVEYIAVIGKQVPNRGLEKDDYSKSYTGKKDADNKLSYSKPVALCEKYLRLFSRKAVLDIFSGSGSTLIAAEKLGRSAWCMDNDPQMADVIVRRWQEFAGKQATLEGDGRTFNECAAAVTDSHQADDMAGDVGADEPPKRQKKAS